MDYTKLLNKLDNLFVKKKHVRYMLSEETLITLDRWELVLEENISTTIAKMERLVHTAPANERAYLKKAIEELKKKRSLESKPKKAKSSSATKYQMIGEWGEEDDELNALKEELEDESLNPDFWYRYSVNPTANRKGFVKTFMYFPYAKKLIVSEGSGHQYPHYSLLEDSIIYSELKLEDLDPEMFPENTQFDAITKPVLYRYLNNEHWIDHNYFINGRTGILPIKQYPVEKPLVSIWNNRVDKKVRDDMMKQLNATLKIKYDTLLVPDSLQD